MAVQAADEKKNETKYPHLKDVTFIPFPRDDKGKRKWISLIH